MVRLFPRTVANRRALATHGQRSEGRPSGQSSYYSSILKSHMNSELNESQKEDFQNATEFVEEHWYDPALRKVSSSH